MTNYEKLVEKALQDRTGDPALTLPGYLLQCAADQTTDATAAAFLGVPITTYRFWQKKHVVEVRTHRLKSEAGQLELSER